MSIDKRLFQQLEVYKFFDIEDIEIGHKFDVTLVMFVHEEGNFSPIIQS